MSTMTPDQTQGYSHDTTLDRTDRRYVGTETKRSTKTTELIAFLGAVVAVVVTAFVVGAGDDGGADPFSALHALQLITYLTIGYMVARGLAKSGTRAHDDA